MYNQRPYQMLKTGENRNQLQLLSLETLVDAQSMARVVDAFVDSLDLDQLGFELKGRIKNGAPAFPASALLKLYYYGYLNRVRSSRCLEREALTNVEAMWLLQGLRPGYKTIANFRKDNTSAIKQAFTNLNKFLKGLDLFDTETVGIDGTKIRAQNSRKNNYNEKKVKQHLEHIEKKTSEYLADLDRLDEEESQVDQESESELEQRLHLAQKLDHLQSRKAKYEELKEQVKQARDQGQSQVSTSDPDARALPKKMGIVEVGYNIVTAAEVKNKLITNYEVKNESDTYALSGVAKEARVVLGKEGEASLTVLADKGFDTGIELKACEENHITTIVAPRKRVYAGKDPAFAKEVFVYDSEKHVYICPEGEALSTNGTWYNKYKKKDSQHRRSYEFQRFTLPFKVCDGCAYKEQCVGKSNLSRSKGRHIERSEYEDAAEANRERYAMNKERYRKRQEVAEHQYGTIKRQWGYDYTLLKTKEKVSAEFAIIFTCYNLRRAITLLGIKPLIEQLKKADSFLIRSIELILSRSTDLFWNHLVTPKKKMDQFYGLTSQLCAKVRLI